MMGRASRGGWAQRPFVVGRVLLALVCTCLAWSPAIAQVRGTVTGPGQSAFTIAVPDLHGDPGRGEIADTFAVTLARDLDLSGYFRVLGRQRTASVSDPGVTRNEIDFRGWSALGARLLVKGRFTIEPGGKLVIEARLFDVAERRRLGGKRYEGAPGDAAEMANRFADEVMLRLTGTQGPFHSKIAFVSTRAGRAKELYVVDFDGSNLRPLTRNDTINLSPAWAPDAQSVFFTSYRDGRPKLYEIDIRSRRSRRILSGRGLTIGGRVSPDGRRIAVTREESKGNPEVLLVTRDGTVQRRITRHGGIDVSPSWSPKGDRLAFCSSRSGSPQVHVVDLVSGETRRVTRQGSYNTQPIWSPTHDRIAFTGRVAGRFQIFVVDVATGRQVQVTRSRGDNVDPSWSPDGRYLVFASTRSGKSRIYVSDWRGRHQRQLIGGAGDDSSPSWSPRLSSR